MEDEKQMTTFDEIVDSGEQTGQQADVNESEIVDKINIEAVLQEISALFQDLYKANQILNSKITNSDKSIRDIEAHLRGLASYVDDSGKRTRRLEEGYDFQILKNFTRQIIREINGLKIAIDKTDNEDKKNTMQDTIDALVELLDRNSIIQITPEPGSLYAGQEKFAECTPQKIFTDDNELNGRIASVVRNGYQYEFNDGSTRVLEPAKVVLFSTNREQCAEPTDFSNKLIRDIKKKIEAYTKAQRRSLWEDEPYPVKPSKSLKNSNGLIYFVIIACLCVLSTILGIIVYQQNRTITEFASKTQTSTQNVKNLETPISSSVSIPARVKQSSTTDSQVIRQPVTATCPPQKAPQQKKSKKTVNK